MSKKAHVPSRRNPVAKFAARFQKASAFRDMTKYRRHNKHKNRESYPVCAVFSA